MTAIHTFDAYLATANSWMKELLECLELPFDDQARALHALRAGLHAIRDRLPDAEVFALGAQLPTIIRGVYYEGWTPHRDLALLRDRAAMIARVRAELVPDLRLDPEDVLRAVIRVLIGRVSAGEIDHVLATLPRSIAELWRELAGPGTLPAEPASVRHTGYSR